MFNPAYNVLLIDDDMDILDSYQDLLRQEGYQVITCADPIDIVAQIPENWIGIILCDVLLPNISGLKILEDIIQRDAQIPVIMITGHGDVPMAVEAVKKAPQIFLKTHLSRKFTDSSRTSIRKTRCLNGKSPMAIRKAERKLYWSK